MLSRRQLYVLVAATLLPVTLFAATMLYLTHCDAQEHEEAHLSYTAQTLASALDRVIAQETAALTVLATAEELDRGDVEHFYIEAKRAVEARDSWQTVIMSDQERQLVNTRLAYGAELPPLLSSSEAARVFETGRPLVTGVTHLPDRFTHPFLSIRVPVTREGTVRYALAAILPAWTFHTLLREHMPAFQGEMVIIDQRDRIVALNDSPDPSDRRVGAPAPSAFLGGVHKASGIFDTVLADGRAMRAAQALAPISGWRVVLVQPVEVIDAALSRTRLMLAGGGLLALALAALVATVLVRLLHRLSAFEAERAAEQRIADIAAHIPGLIYRRIMQPNGTTRYTCMAGGLKPADTAPFNAPSPMETERLDEALRESAATLAPFCFERQSRTDEGDTRWLRCVATPHRMADGTVVWDGLTLDITDLRQAETALRDSESRLRMAQEAAGMATWDWDLPSGRLLWSDSLYRMLGVEPGVFQPDVTTFIEDFVHPDDRQRVLAEAQRASLRGGSVRLEYRVQRADGAVRWLECSGSSVANADGRTVRLLGIVRDMTDRKATEDALHAANAALEREVAEHKRTETLLASLYATAPVGMCVIDSQMRYLRINEYLAAANALPVAGHIGRRMRDVLQPALADAIEPLYRRVLTTGEPLHDFSASGPPPSDPGKEHHWLFNLHPLRQPDGTVYAVNAIVQDITQRKEMEETLRAALRDAQSAIAAKARFFAAASHDLRQPVQTLFLFTHALSERLRDHPTQALVATMQQALEGLKALIDTLLDISRLDSGTLVPEPADFPAVTLMQRLAAEYGPRMSAKGLKFRMVGCPAWIHSDAVLLGRVLGNLLDNALKYTARGGVLIGCRRRGDCVSIEVWDTGAGIALEDQVAIFDEFVQLGTDRRDRTQGLGLGLSIVRRLAKLLGHELTVRSRLGRGSVFSITVPIASAALDSGLPPPLLVAAGSGGPPLAVMVEDDPTILTALGMLLEEWGFETIGGANPDDVLAQIAQRRRRPDLIIADYYLPGDRFGTDVIRQIRAYCNAPVPAIVLTGDTGPERALEVGHIGSHLLLKPVMPDVLQELIERVAGMPKR